jgi:hypothetical protein
MSKPLIPSEFNIDKHFDDYLSLVKLDKRKMPPYQLREIRRAFYGAWGIKMILDRNILTTYDEDFASDILNDQLDQVAKFWYKEISPDFFSSN